MYISITGSIYGYEDDLMPSWEDAIKKMETKF